MCRSIKPLRHPFAAATADDARAAALQYVRKISGYHTPSRANEEAFGRAVEEIAATSMRLLERLVVRGAPGDVAVKPAYRA